MFSRNDGAEEWLTTMTGNFAPSRERYATHSARRARPCGFSSGAESERKGRTYRRGVTGASSAARIISRTTGAGVHAGDNAGKKLRKKCNFYAKIMYKCTKLWYSSYVRIKTDHRIVACVLFMAWIFSQSWQLRYDIERWRLVRAGFFMAHMV